MADNEQVESASMQRRKRVQIYDKLGQIIAIVEEVKRDNERLDGTLDALSSELKKLRNRL